MEQLYYSSLVYFGIISLLFFKKSELFFKDNGEYKQFGVGTTETILPFYLLAFIISVLIYFILTFTA